MEYETKLSLALLIVVIVLVFKGIRDLKIKGTPMYCPNCGTTAAPNRHIRGSFLLEFGLWCLFIIPGIIYSVWRLTTVSNRSCPACEYASMIPANSPKGIKAAG